MKKYILVFLLVLTLSFGYFLNKKERTDQKAASNEIYSTINNLETNTSYPEESKKIPLFYEIKNVPFSSQAPFAVWDDLHDEACEEASLLIAQHFSNGSPLTADLAEEEIQKQVAWEIDYFGSHKDLTASEVVTLGHKFLKMNNLNVVRIKNINDIKNEISQNHLVIVPTAGRLLGNPNFRSPGPIYHMLVISGYNENQFITQDVGTRNGQNYIYNQDVLFNAIHDWTGDSATITAGEKNIIVAN